MLDLSSEKVAPPTNNIINYGKRPNNNNFSTLRTALDARGQKISKSYLEFFILSAKVQILYKSFNEKAAKR